MATKFTSSTLIRLRTLKMRLFSLALCVATQAVAQPSPAPSAPADASNGNPEHPAASAPSAEQCVSSHREAQTMRRQYRLLESRDLLLECGNSACPGPVKRDCLRWLDEVAVQISSVVVHVDTGDSAAPNNVKVYIDGNLRFESIPSRAIELNPGTYRFRFEVAGRQPVELQVTVAEAEKFKNVTVKYSPPAKESDGANNGQENASQNASPFSVKLVAPHTAAPERPVPITTYIFAGLGTAAAANFAIWGLSSRSLRSELEDKCAPNCEQTYIDRLRTRALVADVSLGVSVASFATAAITYFARPQSKPPIDVGLAPLPGGGFMGQLRLGSF